MGILLTEASSYATFWKTILLIPPTLRRSKNIYSLSSLNIMQFFDEIITAEDVEKGKPAPDVFLICAERLDVKPENCIVIEDAPVGIDAAERANMSKIALTTTHSKEELYNANLIANDLSSININDILKLLKLNSSEII